jgi:proteasome lid subunit RPN8/RPN11
MTNPDWFTPASRWSDPPPRLTFTPLAWLKLQYLCHAGPTEVAAFGLAAADDPLQLEDVLLLRQRCTAVTTAFDDEAVADLFDRMVDAGIPPGRFARVWLHTHPGASVEPSHVDEETFGRVFGGCDWAVMAILGRTGNVYARLRFNAGPGGTLPLPAAVDWSAWPRDSARLPEALGQWQGEYAERVDVGTEFPRPETFWPWYEPFAGTSPRPPRRIAAMTEAEFARFEAGLPDAAGQAFGEVDPLTGEVFLEDAEFWDFDILK